MCSSSIWPTWQCFMINWRLAISYFPLKKYNFHKGYFKDNLNGERIKRHLSCRYPSWNVISFLKSDSLRAEVVWLDVSDFAMGTLHKEVIIHAAGSDR